ncbi:hypothetical protein Cadr_000006748 [Camelus dromedarius]|uniref:Uncharacterized protein n=1 Tax=Camelus dromedarius TaxID=9838 RepID=A0A5N4E6B4_CAMDR|nr:hypothetical protein Cadr_000006748 [Camelus dromedarius]
MTTTCYTRDTHGDRTSDLPVHLARSFCSRSLVALPPCPASPITNPESTFEGGLGEHLHPRDQAHFFRSEHLVCRKPLETTCSFISWLFRRTRWVGLFALTQVGPSWTPPRRTPVPGGRSAFPAGGCTPPSRGSFQPGHSWGIP